MATPFKPTLISPGQRAASGTTVTLRFQFNSFGAGETMHSYSVRRRRISPTLGTAEYWTGSAWSGTQAWIAAPGTVYDKQTVSITIAGGWASGDVYEWSIDTRDAALSAGGFANNNILDVHTAPSVTAAASSLSETRPKIVWRFTGATGRRQKSYRWFVYTSAVTAQAGFDPASEYWQTLATWGMSEAEVGSLTYTKRIGADLQNATNYVMYGYVTDDTDLASGWVNAGNFTTSFTAQAPPDVVITPEPDAGRVKIELSTTFNLLDTNTSAFVSGIGNWVSEYNANLTLNGLAAYTLAGSGNSMKVTSAGANYAYLDTTYTTYSNMDTAIGTYAAQTTTQQPTAGALSISTGNSVPTSSPVQASTNYSATVSVFPLVTEGIQLVIKWYKSDGTAATTAQTAGTLTSCPIGTWTSLTINGATSPADAAYARLSVVCTTAAYGDVFYLDGAALARADSVQWTTGGLSVDIGFVIQRSDDGGSTWKYLWGNSHDEPFGTGSTSHIGTYYDRSVPIGGGVPLKYRIAAVSRKTTNPLYSTTVEREIDPLETQGWWIRSVEDPDKDLRVLLSKFSFNEKIATQVYAPENAGDQVVVHMSEPVARDLSGQIWLLNENDYAKARQLFNSTDTLYVQRNIGDGFYFKCTSGLSMEQRSSSSGGKTPNHVHTANFAGTMVAEP